MTARSLLLCCGAFIVLGTASVATTNATALPVPAIDNAPMAFPGSVREVNELIVEADETLRFKGPVETAYDGLRVRI